jgi:osmotically-inducible protein OsmY
VNTPAQKNWAETLVGLTGAPIESRLSHSPIPSRVEPRKQPEVDDESLQALVVLRLKLASGTDLPLRVKANRGVVTIQGKVRTEALRQRVENLARSTVGLRELRSSITLTA